MMNIEAWSKLFSAITDLVDEEEIELTGLGEKEIAVSLYKKLKNLCRIKGET